MFESSLNLGDALANRCSQVLYRCLEEVGSTKGVLYLRRPDGGGLEAVSFYGWPRGIQPPRTIAEDHPLLLLVHRERRCFAVNDPSEAPELAAFAQGGERSRYFVSPVYLAGDWIGLLIQRDRLKGESYEVHRDEAPTLAICDALVQALREFQFYGPPSAARTTQILIDDGAEDTEALAAPEPARDVAKLYVEQQATLFPTKVDEELHGFPAGQGEYSTLPWDGVRTLSGLVEPPTQTERTPGMVAPELRAFFWEIAGLLSESLSTAAVALWTEDTEEIRPILAYSTLPLSEGLQQQILAHATFHLPRHREQDLRLITRAAQAEDSCIEGAFATYLPILFNETFEGHDLLLVFRQEDHSFSLPEIETIERFGRILGYHIQESRLHERYHHAFLSVSHRILQSSESRFPSLRPHSLATARLARELAIELDLPTEEVEAVSIAAILHDVGLLMVDPQMLLKSQLSEEDHRKVRHHPDLAAVFLKDLRFPFDVVKIIRHHHERWDGRGYPEGLQETGIPIGSRIIGLVEAYEVMTSGQGYRRPKSPREVFEELEYEAGSQFDPAIVASFRKLLTQKEAWS